ncbi:MarR family winged helix-turn-helix transcriptional regulator [Anaerosalibacter sp. Marseille-P3206]|uniref:MarR family winged helix-turn-helix transcriptional regulator n=1 Tax=Anaerosalibacter sp. Marseille-P3206 TaxID=1871005 RepID=UPI000985A433|nr:MarR family transcriptional regulator [Anaerosalibacter sp. Marseille-P3206]
MKKIEKAEKIYEYIRECEKIIHRKGHEIAQEHNLTIDQYHILVVLNHSQLTPTIGEIADKFCKAQNTMSERISRLEEKKLVERINDLEDRRITRVNITKEGKELVETIRKERSSVFVLNAIANMKEEDVDELIRQLENLYLHLEEEE